MAFKSILAALAPTPEKQTGSVYAISMGQAMKAYVSACAYTVHPKGSDFPWFPEELLENHLATVAKEAHSAIRQFNNIAETSKVEVGSEVLTASFDAAISAFGEKARTFDITVITQSRPGLEHIGDLFTEAALFYSGRPIIIVPRNHSGEFNIDHVLIAWDGSQHAAAAIAHAMPILALANKIEVLVIGDKDRVSRTRAPELVTNLKRHGFDVDLVNRDDHDDANAIAREAAVWGASLIVMGGFGHSKFREMVFGGVTEFMFKKTLLPIFMAH